MDKNKSVNFLNQQDIQLFLDVTSGDSISKMEGTEFDNTKVNLDEFIEHEARIQQALSSGEKLDLIMIIGNTGVGKSTTINLLKHESVRINEEGNLSAEEGQQLSCVIGEDQTRSCTLMPQIVELDDTLGIIDTPGALHTQDNEASIANITVPLILQRAKLKGFIILVEENSIAVNKGQDFKQTIDNFVRLIGHDNLKGRTLFVVTKARLPNFAIERRLETFKANTLASDLINETNTFIIRAENNPDIDLLRDAIFALKACHELNSDAYAYDMAVRGEQSSPFMTLCIEIDIETREREVSEYTWTLGAIRGISYAMHKVYIHEVHVPDVMLIRGAGIKRALSYFWHNCVSGRWQRGFEIEEFKQLVFYLERFTNICETSFANCGNVIDGYNEIIESCNYFVRNQARVVDQGLRLLEFISWNRNLFDRKDTNAMLLLRNVQRDLLNRISLTRHTGNDTDILEDTEKLLKKLNESLKSPEKFHSFVGGLVRYHKHTNSEGINPLLMAKNAYAMMRLELDNSLVGDNIDADNEIIHQTVRAIDTNLAYVQEIATDRDFFDKLLQNYYTAVAQVDVIKTQYIDSYQETLKHKFDEAYSNGHNTLPVTLHILESENVFLAQFNGKSINKLQQTQQAFVSGSLQSRYPETDRELNLPAGNFYSYLSNRNVNALGLNEWLAGEYLGLVKFQQVLQSEDLYYPEIKLFLTEDEKHEVWGWMCRIGNFRLVGNTAYSGLFNYKFFNGDLNFAIKFIIKTEEASTQSTRDICKISISGTYSDLQVSAQAFIGGSMYSQEHYMGISPNIIINRNTQQRQGLSVNYPMNHDEYFWVFCQKFASYVREKWEGGQLQCTAIENIESPPDIKEWFVQQRNVIGNALITYAENSNEIPVNQERDNLLKKYKAAVQQLDLTVRLIQAYAKLIGKDVTRESMVELVNSHKLVREIERLVHDTEHADLTPSLTSIVNQIEKLTSEDIFELPFTNSFYDTRNILKTSKNLLCGLNAWRIAKNTLEPIILTQPFGHIELEKFIVEMSHELSAFELHNRELNLLQASSLAFKLQYAEKLVHLSLKNVALDNELGWLILGISFTSLSPSLEVLDLSHNPRLGVAGDTRGLVKFNQILLVMLTNEDVRLQKLNLSHTSIDGSTLNVLTSGLLKNTSLRVLDISSIDKCSALDSLKFIASLYINQSLSEVYLDCRTMPSLLVDFIKHFIEHKKNHKDKISTNDLEERIVYFDAILNEFFQNYVSVDEEIDWVSINIPFTIIEDSKKTFTLADYVRKLDKGLAIDVTPSIIAMPKQDNSLLFKYNAGFASKRTEVSKVSVADARGVAGDLFSGFRIEQRGSSQNGWNCFDVAVGITRDQIVHYALENADDLEYRKLLTPEIKHAIAETVSYLNEVVPNQSNRTGILPRSMHTDEMKETYNAYDKANEQLEAQARFITCNEKMGKSEGKRLNKDELIVFFQNEENQSTYMEAYRHYQEYMSYILPYELALNEYAQREDIYKGYVRDYYGSNEWFSFVATAKGENPTSMIDIVAKMLQTKIVIHQQHGKDYSTADYGVGQSEEIHVGYVGNNHFVHLVRVSAAPKACLYN